MNESLRSYGWSQVFDSRLRALGQPDLRPGRVIQSQRGLLRLQTERGPADARLSGRSLFEANGAADLPVVGDWVAFRPDSDPLVVRERLAQEVQLRRQLADRWRRSSRSSGFPPSGDRGPRQSG